MAWKWLGTPEATRVLNRLWPDDPPRVAYIEDGICACGAATSRCLDGIGFQCRPCAEKAFQALFPPAEAVGAQRQEH